MACAISMVLFIVNCGLKVGNSFLYIFSRFLSFTEILDTFDFLCLCFFSLTDLFLCASETKKTTTTRRVSIFSDDREKNSYSRYQTEEMETFSICFQNTHIKVIPIIAAPHQDYFYIITDTMY